MYAIVFNGKVETEQLDQFITGFNNLLKETDSDFIGRIENYELARYVDYQKIEEPVTVESNVEVKGNRDTDL